MNIINTFKILRKNYKNNLKITEFRNSMASLSHEDDKKKQEKYFKSLCQLWFEKSFIHTNFRGFY